MFDWLATLSLSLRYGSFNQESVHQMTRLISSHDLTDLISFQRAGTRNDLRIRNYRLLPRFKYAVSRRRNRKHTRWNSFPVILLLDSA
ncbi:hypothetical protein J6590_010780 [Homalodisca vitripennis]|nr:hypothetical protein J6590_010780 [Homalodisca vitripennis]